MFLNNESVNHEIKGENKSSFGTNENGHTTAQNLGDTVKTVLKVRFIAL